MAATTQSVLDRHIAAVDSGDVQAVLADYAADAVLLTPEGAFHGHDQIRPILQRLLADVFAACTSFEMIQQLVAGDVAYIAWSAESPRWRMPLATDTFVIRHGKIAIQTFAAHTEEKPVR